MNRKNDLASVTDRLRALCSRREYCSRDILSKAKRALEGDMTLAAQVLDTLIKERYVDDLRYSTAYVRDKSAISGWGSSKIRYMLSAKGISREIIDNALLEVDEGKAEERFDKLIRNKYRSLKEDSQCRLKLLRFAVGRGYQYDDAKSMIDRILQENVEK